MEDLLIHGLQNIYCAEQQIITQDIEKGTNRDLIAGLKAHLEETNKQVERLEKVFEKLGQQPSGTPCSAIDGIIKEAGRAKSRTRPCWTPPLSRTPKAVEHYEMCRYGTLGRRTGP
jgi:ferritin-like metal-binding protein YciE